MVENETLIDKISKHPKLWGIIVPAAAVICIVLGALGLAPVKTVPATDLADRTGLFDRAEGVVVRCDMDSFEIRNTFCRYLPTGVQYFYLAYTEDNQPIFVRAGKNWSDNFDKELSEVKIYGSANSFNESEKAYIEETYALRAEGFVDLIYVRLNVLLIAMGALLLANTVLGALMITEKIPSRSRGYKFANIVFCTLPVVTAAIGIHLVGFV